MIDKIKSAILKWAVKELRRNGWTVYYNYPYSFSPSGSPSPSPSAEPYED